MLKKHIERNQIFPGRLNFFLDEWRIKNGGRTIILRGGELIEFLDRRDYETSYKGNFCLSDATLVTSDGDILYLRDNYPVILIREKTHQIESIESSYNGFGQESIYFLIKSIEKRGLNLFECAKFQIFKEANGELFHSVFIFEQNESVAAVVFHRKQSGEMEEIEITFDDGKREVETLKKYETEDSVNEFDLDDEMTEKGNQYYELLMKMNGGEF